MLQVARIRPAGGQGSRRIVALADGRRFLLDAEAVPRLGLAEGSTVDQAAAEHLAAIDAQTRAGDAALRLLRYRPRSRAELIERLRRRGFARQAIDAAVAALTTQGLVDDARFTRMWVEARLASGQSGPHRVRAELRRLGVAPGTIEEILAAAFGQREAELARAVAARHLRRMRALAPQVRLRRLAGLLRRRGFSAAVIAPLLRAAGRRPGEDLLADLPPGDG